MNNFFCIKNSYSYILILFLSTECFQSNSSDTTDYYGVNASTANTSRTEPVLPLGDPFNTLSLATNIKIMDNV